MSRRSHIVVVGIGALSALACSGEVEPEPTRNPPPPKAIREVQLTPDTPPGTVLNAFRDGDGMIYRAHDGRCAVYPSDGKRRPPGQMPPALVLDCPPTMQDPAWDACIVGSLRTTDDPTACVCGVTGNPPPPAKQVPCPKHGT